MATYQGVTLAHYSQCHVAAGQAISNLGLNAIDTIPSWYFDVQKGEQTGLDHYFDFALPTFHQSSIHYGIYAESVMVATSLDIGQISWVVWGRCGLVRSGLEGIEFESWGRVGACDLSQFSVIGNWLYLAQKFAWKFVS